MLSLSLQQLQPKLQSEGLVPSDAGNSGGPVAFSHRGCIYWGCIYQKDCCRMNFTDDDFYHLYLQIEMGKNFVQICVKLSIKEDEAGRTFDKERVRRVHKRIQDYFVRNVAGFRRTRFQFNSPKSDEDHARWLTVGRCELDKDNYRAHISAIQKTFDALKK
ncbi:MAG: hypothetical protein IJP68_02800 [Selenomonadaceae bacterium]|nr:hypothetical protein [Selenomonadaceae bacterium]